LEKFLQQQRKEIQAKLSLSYPNLPADATQVVLDMFVTEEGTKRPVLYERVDGEIQLEARLQKQLNDIPASALQEILTSFEQARILRFTENQVELAHDSLAELIDRERSTEQRQLNQIKRRIAAAYVEQKETGVFLTARQLASIDDFLPRLRLEPHLEQFIQDCYSDVETKEKAEAERIQRELQLAQDKLTAEQRAAKRQRVFSGIIGVALIIAMIAGGWAWKQQKTLSAQQTRIQEESEKAIKALEDFQKAEAEKVSSEVDDIITRAKSLKERYPKQYQAMLKDAQNLLDDYPENEILTKKKEEVDRLLAE
ncbi:MAG: hypothetical protein KDD63_28375, partial [Bacteroidetes bacterium]|nr:hypothetical protein [Bacteroidota bacterium]